METIVSSISIGVIVVTLIGVVYKNLGDKVKDNRDLKVNKETCKIIHVAVDEKFTALFETLKEHSDMLSEIKGDVKAIMRGVNGG